jgi:deoxyuridine 5'-triphosphate nucleotidohydrolase
MPELDVPVRLIDADAVPPRYALPGDAGADLSAAEDVELAPFQRALVGTGVAVAIPEGYAGFVHPRSGLAHRLGLSMVNAPGTIDAGYRGEIKVNLINLDPTSERRVHLLQVLLGASPQPAGQGSWRTAGVHRVRGLTDAATAGGGAAARPRAAVAVIRPAG